MEIKCEICGQHQVEKTWYLEPKPDDNSGKFIMVCRFCYQDLVMIRRWRRHGR
jgi:hypothetical protein